jgi:hypothetical protein
MALAEQFFTTQEIRLITTIRTNMCERLLAYTDRLPLHKRALIESVNDQLKHICQIEHSRQRSPYTFLARLLSGPIAYCQQPQQSSRHLDRDLDPLAARSHVLSYHPEQHLTQAPR